MEPVAPDIHEFAWSRVVRSVNRTGQGLREQRKQQKPDKGQTEYAQETQETPSDRPMWAWRNGGRACTTVDRVCHVYVSFSREEHTLLIPRVVQRVDLFTEVAPKPVRCLHLIPGKTPFPHHCHQTSGMNDTAAEANSCKIVISLRNPRVQV